MEKGSLRRGPVVGLAAVVLAAVITQIALAGGGGTAGGSQATISISNKKLRSLIKREVSKQIANATGPQGPAGQSGAPGTAPACQGNGSGDTMVSAGAVCIDKYEVSIWTAAEGGTQITGTLPCNANGEDCTNIFARSVPSVTPRASVTYFQAQQALANVGKHLPSNAEWQQAVAGTPDSTACNVSTGVVAGTGANAGCISNHGANDMAGNLWEWVGDWDEESGGLCANWPSGFGSDSTCIGRADGQASTGFPAALIRGGEFISGQGPFTVNATVLPTSSNGVTGFRGAR